MSQNGYGEKERERERETVLEFKSPYLFGRLVVSNPLWFKKWVCVRERVDR